MQKSLIVTGSWNTNGEWSDDTEELNELFAQGYKLVSATPMGAFAYGHGYGDGEKYSHFQDSFGAFGSLIIVEK